jgi:DNA-binding transcriptional LysR family regulator
MDRLTSMAVFVKAAESGSFAAAAGALGLSSQMVGKHVLFLEDRLGTRLLNRTTRRQSLTEFGRAYYERCKIVLAEAEAADSLAPVAGTVPRGRLRVNAPVTFGAHCLAPLLARYLQVHPEVEVDLTLSDRFVDLVEEGFEAVIRLGPLRDSTLAARSLAPYRLMACAAPAYLAAHGTPETPADLARHECLGFTEWARDLAREWQFTRAGTIYPAPARGRFRANDSKALLAAALAGFGIVLGAEAVLREAVEAGRLVRLLPEYEPPSRPMHLLFAADRRPTPKLRGFIDLVVAEFGGGGAEGQPRQE